MLRLLAALALVALPGTALAAPFSVVLLGDSITFGQVSEPVGPSYAELLADSLGSDFAVTNIGCGGTSSLDWTRSRGSAICGGVSGFVLPDLYEGRALPTLPADLVTIMLGTNDAIGFFEPGIVAVEDYRDAILEIATSLLLDGADQVMLMTPPPNFVSTLPASFIVQYRAQVLDICGAPGDAILCGPDVYALLGPSDFGNSIHPNAAGNAKIASALDPAIRSAVPEPGSAALVLLGLSALTLRAFPRTVAVRVRKTG
jgi:lysophospholipase L1-like esterase